MKMLLNLLLCINDDIFDIFLDLKQCNALFQSFLHWVPHFVPRTCSAGRFYKTTKSRNFLFSCQLKFCVHSRSKQGHATWSLVVSCSWQSALSNAGTSESRWRRHHSLPRPWMVRYNSRPLKLWSTRVVGQDKNATKLERVVAFLPRDCLHPTLWWSTSCQEEACSATQHCCQPRPLRGFTKVSSAKECFRLHLHQAGPMSTSGRSHGPKSGSDMPEKMRLGLGLPQRSKALSLRRCVWHVLHQAGERVSWAARPSPWSGSSNGQVIYKHLGTSSHSLLHYSQDLPSFWESETTNIIKHSCLE